MDKGTHALIICKSIKDFIDEEDIPVTWIISCLSEHLKEEEIREHIKQCEGCRMMLEKVSKEIDDVLADEERKKWV